MCVAVVLRSPIQDSQSVRLHARQFYQQRHLVDALVVKNNVWIAFGGWPSPRAHPPGRALRTHELYMWTIETRATMNGIVFAFCRPGNTTMWIAWCRMWIGRLQTQSFHHRQCISNIDPSLDLSQSSKLASYARRIGSNVRRRHSSSWTTGLPIAALGSSSKER